MFFDMEKCVYSENGFNTRINSLGTKLTVQKMPCFSFAVQTHHSITFNLQFLHELKHQVCLSKAVCGVFHFRIRFVFMKDYNFVRQNAWTL